MIDNNNSSSFENAIVLENYSGNAKIRIPSIMPLLNSNNVENKTYPVSSNNILNEDTTFFNNVPNLNLCNYYEVSNAGEGFKGSTLLVAFVANDINNIVII